MTGPCSAKCNELLAIRGASVVVAALVAMSPRYLVIEGRLDTDRNVGEILRGEIPVLKGGGGRLGDCEMINLSQKEEEGEEGAEEGE